jgi:hypothetical protein
MIPRAAKIGFAASRSRGHRLAKTIPAMTQKPPPIDYSGSGHLVSGDPASKLPNGAMPTSIIENRLITRPRI